MEIISKDMTIDFYSNWWKTRALNSLYVEGIDCAAVSVEFWLENKESLNLSYITIT